MHLKNIHPESEKAGKCQLTETSNYFTLRERQRGFICDDTGTSLQGSLLQPLKRKKKRQENNTVNAEVVKGNIMHSDCIHSVMLQYTKIFMKFYETFTNSHPTQVIIKILPLVITCSGFSFNSITTLNLLLNWRTTSIQPDI